MNCLAEEDNDGLTGSMSVKKKLGETLKQSMPVLLLRKFPELIFLESTWKVEIKYENAD